MREFGGPEVLELTQTPPPQAAEGEVLIRVARAGVNFADTLVRSNSYLAKATLPLIPGVEVVGRREDDGARVAAFCASGGYAEYAVAPATLTFPIPDGVEDDQAAALLLQGTTAWHLHRTCARLAPGESVVVHSAAGGVGSIAVQLAWLLGGGRVIASASSEAKRALALELGAHDAIDADPAEMTDAILAANDGRRVDVVLDAVGGDTFDASLAALAPFGRLVVYGIADRRQNELRTGALLRRSHAVIGFWMAHALERPAMVRDALRELFELVAGGRLRILIGGTYPLAQAGQAHLDLAARRTTGKLLIDPWA
jgi:NADPH2:quinone reductase